jgi:putative NADH-flavin reductase
MKLVVLGATGGTGLQVLPLAIEHGHTVTAVVRAPEKLAKFNEQVSTIQGDLLSESELKNAIQAQDAVLSTFGPRTPESKAEANLLRQFAVALTTAMREADVRRLVVVSTAFLFKDSVIPPTHLFGKLFFPITMADAEEMEAIIQNSGLDWTIVRPPRLTDKAATGKYRVREGHLPTLGFTVSRADVANFMIQAVETGSFSAKIAGISN